MHDLRSALRAREGGAPARPLSLEERRREAPPVDPATLPNGERRASGDRRAERHRGLVERAVIRCRGKKALVPVTNISKGGATIETKLAPEIGETLILELPGKAPAEARVRWVNDGRIGLALAG
ncbi:MAG TPA: PilZ domain-containing protein [Allosphingosinicella sp.]|nr:PilZ domain-containing protein [Allosphingosinicella sp.]